MPVPKKRTISQPDLAKGESAEEKMPEEQEFRQYLRSLAVSAVRVLIEKVMCEELDQCVGAGWGECTPERKGYRNGYYGVCGPMEQSTRGKRTLYRTMSASEAPSERTAHPPTERYCQPSR